VAKTDRGTRPEGGRVAGILAAVALALVVPADRGWAAETLHGVVLYADPEWRLAFVHDGTRAVRVELAEPDSPLPGRRVEAEGQPGRVRDLPALTTARLRDMGSGLLPEPTDEPPPARDPKASALRWSRVTGFVREASQALARASLRVAVSGMELDVIVPEAPLDGAPLPELGTEMRLRGVLEPAADGWSRPVLWVAGWHDTEVIRRAPEWASLPASTVKEAIALWRSGPTRGEIRLQVRPVERQSVHTFLLEDATGRISAEMNSPDLVISGAQCQVRGYLETRRDGPLLADARWQALETPSFHVSRREQGLRALASVRDVRALPKAEAERGYPVRLRAVVTYAEPAANQLFVQDDSGGIYVYAAYRDLGVRTGDSVLVEGFTAPGGLAPIVVEPRLVPVGRRRLPAPRSSSASSLATGSDDCRRIEISGIVRSVRRREARAEVSLFVEGRRVLVVVPDGSGMRATLPVANTRLRVRGVCGTRFDWHGQFVGAAVFVGDPDDLAVEEPPSPSPFDEPARAVRDLLREGHEPERGRLVRISGVVLHHRPGQPLYLRDATGTVVVETDQREPLAPGDHVDVVGFPATDGAGPRLEDASYRPAGHGLPPAPVAVEAGQVVGGTLTAELVRLEAPILSSVQGETGTTLLLQLGHGVLEARGDGDLPAGLSLEPGSLLAAQGILLAHRDEGAEPILRLLVRSPADVAVIRRPPWWTPARAAWAVGGLVAGLMVAFVWLSTLHRQVRSQTAVLRESEERYRLLAENASDVIVTLDAKLHCTYASPSAARQTGYSVEELLRMPLERLLTPDSFAVALSTLRAVAPEVEKAAPTGALTLELETVGKDRSRRWYEVRLSLLRERGGPVQGFLAVARDVTSRYHTQRELARLATAVDQAAEAVVLTDLEGAILYVNPAFERITGYTAAEAIGQNPRLLKSGLQDRAFYAELWSVVRSGKTWEGRFTNRRKDGSIFLEDASISPIREPASGRPIGYVALKRDVTRQVQLESHLAQTQKMEAVGRLAAGVAHDFNNMLAAILGLADVAVRRAGSDTGLLPLLTGIRDAALRAAQLTRQILTFSRQSPTELRPIELGPIVEEAVRLMRNLVVANVEIRGSLESKTVVAADPTQIHQVVLNLGINGSLAMREGGGVLDIALEDVELDAAFAKANPSIHPGRFLRLTVRDGGSGMTPDVLERAFEPFFTTRPQGEGTGMGLAVVHGIVHRHGGIVTARSEPGQGSTFSVYLPAVTAPSVRADAAEPPLPRGQERILLVDDEEAVATAAERMLVELGYTVSAFTRPTLALERFEAEPGAFDLALLDLAMPSLGGDLLSRAILRLRPIPIVIVTASAERLSPAQAEAMGVAALALKPLSLRGLAEAVRGALDAR
jgi:PAS domain S-box-containing protein